MKEQREYERMQYNKTIFYFVMAHEMKKLKMLNLKGQCIDISDSGIGISTGYPLESGHVIKFDVGVNCKIGHVMWSAKTDNNMYRAGIKFKWTAGILPAASYGVERADTKNSL